MWQHKVFCNNKGKGRKDWASRKNRKESVAFQGDYFYMCMDLTSWMRWGDYIFRFNEIAYFLGYRTNLEKVDVSLKQITDEIIPLINDHFAIILHKAQEWFNNPQNYLKYYEWSCKK